MLRYSSTTIADTLCRRSSAQMWRPTPSVRSSRSPIPTTSGARPRLSRIDSVTNQAILGGGPGCFFCRPVIGLVDLTAGTFSEFTGIGFGGFINGIAVDGADGIFVTTSEDDAAVEFYNLSSQTGFPCNCLVRVETVLQRRRRGVRSDTQAVLSLPSRIRACRAAA